MRTIKCVVCGDAVDEYERGDANTAMLISYTTNKYPSEYIPTVSNWTPGDCEMAFCTVSQPHERVAGRYAVP